MSKSATLRELRARRYGVFALNADGTIELVRDGLDAAEAMRVDPYYRLTLHDKREFVTARVTGVNVWFRCGAEGGETFTRDASGAIVRTVAFYESY